MEGTIQYDGKILADDGKLYEPRRYVNADGSLTVLIEGTSWGRMSVEAIVGRRVVFRVSPYGVGYNYTLIENTDV